jgi:hypothetical protein
VTIEKRRLDSTVEVLHAGAGVVGSRLQLCLEQALAEDGNGANDVEGAARSLHVALEMGVSSGQEGFRLERTWAQLSSAHLA